MEVYYICLKVHKVLVYKLMNFYKMNIPMCLVPRSRNRTTSLYWFLRAAITSYCKFSGNTRNLFSHGSGGQKSEIKMSSGAMLPSGGAKAGSFLASCSSDDARWASACGCLTPVSAHFLTGPFSFSLFCVFSSIAYKDTCHWI